MILLTEQAENDIKAVLPNRMASVFNVQTTSDAH